MEELVNMTVLEFADLLLSSVAFLLLLVVGAITAFNGFMIATNLGCEHQWKRSDLLIGVPIFFVGGFCVWAALFII